MGEPLLQSDPETNVFGKKDFSLNVVFGASVVTSWQGKDLTITRNSAGNYTILCPTNYNLFHEFGLSFIKAAGTLLQGCIVSSTLGVDGKFIVEIRNSGGAATDPANGDIALINFAVSKDILNNKFVGP